MPTYEYACSACSHQWEQVQRITEDPVKTCPNCAKPEAHRLISATNFILKGGGWYSDLYASPKAAAKADEPTGEAGAAKPDAKPETKTEAPAAAGKSAAAPGTGGSGTAAAPAASPPPTPANSASS